MDYFFEEKYEHVKFDVRSLPPAEYEQCSFSRCDLSNANLNRYKFIDCTFEDCNLSMVSLAGTVMNNVQMRGCKLLGIQWSGCDKFMFSMLFKECLLANASFYNFNIKKTIFDQCDLKEVDFSAADMSECALIHCDLHQAIFDQTNLSKADLRTAYNYSIDPNGNRLKGAIFSSDNIQGLLDVFQIKIV